MFNRNKQRREMAEEFAHHIELRAEELTRSGLSPEEAQRRARSEFGSIENYKEQGRQARGLQWLDELWADLRYGIRTYKASPGFTATAIGVLAIAIGANTALFSFFNEFVLKPLPVLGAEQNFEIRSTYRTINSRDTHTNRAWTRAEADILRAGASSRFADIYEWSENEEPMSEPVAITVRVTYISDNFLQVLGAPILMGRAVDDNTHTAVLGYEAWQTKFRGDPAILGKRIRIREREFTITAVTGESFRGLHPWPSDLFIPIRFLKDADNEKRIFVGGHAASAPPLDHLKEPLAAANNGRIEYLEVAAEPKTAHIPFSFQTQMLAAPVFGAFFLVLLIACANLANLLLARSASRSREIAIRLSLGAPRWRVVRQLLTESVLLSVTAAALGLAVANAAIPAVHEFLFAIMSKAKMFVPAPALDWRVFSYTALLSIATGVVFGLAPALQSTRPDALKLQRRRGTVVIVQTAASAVLLLLAAVFVADARRMSATDPGFAIDRVIALTDQTHPLLESALKNDPRFAAVLRATRIPLFGGVPPLAVKIGDRALALHYNFVDTNYFATLNIPLRQGAPGVVVSESTARKFWPDKNPVGQTFEIIEGHPGRYEVTGVAADVSSRMLLQGRDSTMAYFTIPAETPKDTPMLVKSNVATHEAIDALQKLCAETAGGLVCRPMPMTDILWMQNYPIVIARGVATTVGVIALLLTCIGLHGLVGYAVVQRTREIGIRIALGASQLAVVRLMIGRTARQVLIGAIIGLPVAMGLILFIKSKLRLEEASHVLPFTAAPLILLLVAAGAAALPARRATKIDPASALRHD
jgi:predicted permease